MVKAQNTKKAMLALMCMFMLLLSYGPFVEEIGVLAGNVTTDNAVISFLDSWFGLFWAILVCFFLASAIYYIVIA